MRRLEAIFMSLYTVYSSKLSMSPMFLVLMPTGRSRLRATSERSLDRAGTNHLMRRIFTLIASRHLSPILLSVLMLGTSVMTVKSGQGLVLRNYLHAGCDGIPAHRVSPHSDSETFAHSMFSPISPRPTLQPLRPLQHGHPGGTCVE